MINIHGDAADRLFMSLREIYEKSGYSRYKMSKFEEYDLYARNKDFLISDNIITFNENGKLMALKPDVTLSIVRASQVNPGEVQKLYYSENVYRESGNNHAFREIMQAGLECIGCIDDFCLAEVLVLAAKSLREISPDCSLVLSHTGIVSNLLSAIELTEDERAKALRFIGEKNGHELNALLKSAGVEDESASALQTLVRLHGSAVEVLPVLKNLSCCEAEISQLEQLVEAVRQTGLEDVLQLDFSVVNSMRYYSGIVFKGYVSGIPVSVLSGGRYDPLLKKMGKNSGAVGFAVYLDTIESLLHESSEYDVDTVLLYGDGQSPAELLSAVEALQAEGSVLAVRTLPPKLRYRQVREFGIEEVPGNA